MLGFGIKLNFTLILLNLKVYVSCENMNPVISVWYLCISVFNWTVDDVLEWLETHVELPQYIDVFVANGVDGTFLPRYAHTQMHVHACAHMHTHAHTCTHTQTQHMLNMCLHMTLMWHITVFRQVLQSDIANVTSDLLWQLSNVM